MLDAEQLIAGPIHMHSGLGVRWTTVNFAEAIQGVQTPLGWTFWSLVMETSVRRAFADLGALPVREAPVPTDPSQRISGIFLGRAAGNVTMFRRLGDCMVGTSGDAVEEQFFGEVAAAGEPAWPGARRRYPVVAVKTPRAALRAARRIPALRVDYRTWWRSAVIDSPPADLVSAQALLRESARRFIEVGEWHAIVSMIGTGVFDQVQLLAERAHGSKSAALDLISGYGGMEETGMLVDLWEVAQDVMTMDEFLARHGYHGPDEGQLPTTVWREDPSPVRGLLQSYKAAPDPRVREAAQVQRRAAAERALLAALPAARRPGAKVVLRIARALIPMRELGKASFLHALDGARCAARALGAVLADAGSLAEPDDVFLLTYDEAVGPQGADWRSVVAARRALMAAYDTVTVEPMWVGNPKPIPVTETAPETPAEPVTQLQGVGVVGSTVTGVARVVTDPRDVDLDDGEILVCKTTDPSWVPLFLVAAALVIDTGGAMSHGAIVARELGVTCVINTVIGTRDIPDGATITVDGTSGLVVVHDAVA